jgi:hypothetical protein
VAELGFDVLPAVFEERTFIIEADKIGLGAPSKTVTHMDRGGTAAVHFLIAMGTVMYLIKIFFAGV